MDRNPQPIHHPAAWTVDTLTSDKRWVVNLSDSDIAEIDKALAHAKARGASVPSMAKEDFPLEGLNAKLCAVVQELVNGMGIVLIKGLPMVRYSKLEAGLIFWGLGRHMGNAIAQNAYGDVLGHVFDLGKDPSTDTGARGYQSALKLPFHTDAADVVGLMCLRTAKQGGASSVASSLAVYNTMAAERPDLLQRLHEDFYFDARKEQGEGEAPFYPTPIYQRLGEKVYCRYVRRFIDSAQRFDDVPRLDAQQLEALELFEEVQQDKRLRYDMELEPGDMQFLNNYVMLHSRTAYEDHAEIDRKRHLLRLWLNLPEQGPVPASFERRARFSELWSRTPRAPIYDIAQLMGATEH